MIGVQEMVFITQQQHSDTVYHFDKNSDKQSSNVCENVEVRKIH